MGRSEVCGEVRFPVVLVLVLVLVFGGGAGRRGCCRAAASASDRNNTGRRGAGGEIQGVSPGGLGRPAPDVGLVVYPKGKTAGAR